MFTLYGDQRKMIQVLTRVMYVNQRHLPSKKRMKIDEDDIGVLPGIASFDWREPYQTTGQAGRT